MPRREIKKLDASAVEAFQALADWLDYRKPEMSNPTRTRLRVFFQDNPVADIRIEQDCER